MPEDLPPPRRTAAVPRSVANVKQPAKPTFASMLAGKWVPQGGSCAESDSSDFLPLIIDKAKAAAGDGSCSFLSRRQVGSRWALVAECTDGEDAWTSNISLAVDKNRLTWSSERGVASYVRCEPTVVAKLDRRGRVASRRSASKVARAGRRTIAAVRVITGPGGRAKPGWAVLRVR